jgi:hypothetical protein
MGPGTAYSTENAESFVYRREEDGKKWKAISTVFQNQLEQQFQYLPQTQRLVENSMLSITMAYFALPTQVSRGND